GIDIATDQERRTPATVPPARPLASARPVMPTWPRSAPHGPAHPGVPVTNAAPHISIGVVPHSQGDRTGSRTGGRHCALRSNRWPITQGQSADPVWQLPIADYFRRSAGRVPLLSI